MHARPGGHLAQELVLLQHSKDYYPPEAVWVLQRIQARLEGDSTVSAGA